MENKFIDFSELGIQCYCGKLSAYIACDKHINYPKITNKHTIRIPVCPECRIVCDECNANVSIPEFIDKLEIKDRKKNFKNQTKKLKKIKFKKQIVKENQPVVQRSIEDMLNLLNDLSIKDKKLMFFKQATMNSINLIFSMDVGSQLGLEEINKKLKEYNIEPNINFDKLTTKIYNIVFLLLLVRSSGLSKYEDIIMKSEIKRVFSSNSESKEKLKSIIQKVQNRNSNEQI